MFSECAKTYTRRNGKNFKNVYLVYSFLDYYAVVLLVKSVDEALRSPWNKFDTTELDK